MRIMNSPGFDVFLCNISLFSTIETQNSYSKHLIFTGIQSYRGGTEGNGLQAAIIDYIDIYLEMQYNHTGEGQGAMGFKQRLLII